jgi:hypothetical protein
MSIRLTPLVHRILQSAAIHPAVLTAVIVALGAWTAAPLSAAEPARVASSRPTRTAPTETRPRAVVDHAVQPAGGAACRECGPGGCQHRQPNHGHHRNCRDGACVPYCPVRPGTFGFYGTQWRRWPGQGVVPVSNEEAATPAVPPKSEVPGADEESIGPKPSELPEPDMPAADGMDPGMDRRGNAGDMPFPPEPDAAPAEEPTTERAPAAAEPPAAVEPREVPQAEESKPAQPEATAPKPRPQDENLFDDSAARKLRRKIPVVSMPAGRLPAGKTTVGKTSAVGGAQAPRRESTGRVRPANHERDEAASEIAPAAAPVGAPRSAGAAAKPRTVPRVPFDPRAETARMRQAR